MKTKLLITLLIAILSSPIMASSFTYNIQQAGYDFDQYDFKGEASYEIFLDAFQTFPWKNQVGENSGKSEPTISVINQLRQSLFKKI